MIRLRQEIREIGDCLRLCIKGKGVRTEATAFSVRKLYQIAAQSTVL